MKDIFIIAMTGDHEKFLKAGMNDYIAKPVQFEELKKALERWHLLLSSEKRHNQQACIGK
jgi:response regulator of citrate/malate metabolism